jgi:4-phospho-D-threonate 3-dehydrogenase / 4-phospho-D-erythronate 3-dehydrogenase
MRTIAITLGDVAGIGPEVVRKALRSSKLNRKFRYEVVLEDEAPRVALGKLSKTAGHFAWDALEAGVGGCLDGTYAALVTGPVSKAGLKLAGFKHPGQTEWLAHRTSTRKFAMMLVGGSLRVSLVTTHMPLRQVSRALTRHGILETIQLTHEWLKKLGIRKPRILVAALNPHGGVASEQGTEEKKIILPAVMQAQKRFGSGIQGPYSPDHVFWLAHRGRADAVVCMYHDQGLIPLKMLSFEFGVNLTLGLPIVRTSPDHGTGYDIAGKNRANPQSMIEAINLAAQLCLRSKS